MAALRRSGQVEDAWALCSGYAVRTIERRIGTSASVASAIPRLVLGHMLAGALMESIEWWLEHPSTATPAGMDAAFHELARGVLRGPR